MTVAKAPACAVSVEEVSRQFGSVQALIGTSLDVMDGRFVSLLGPSGCGKTTLMRIVAGLDRQHCGRVHIAGKDMTRTPPHGRPVGLVFQRYALFPHMTVVENISFPLRLRRESKARIAARVQELLDLVQLPDFGARSIDQLSGGQAQRVALARALADNPPVLLLDEPMTALDLKLRQAMQLELRRLQRRIGATFLFVTHDQDEAMVMSDEIVLMNEGRIVQRGSPEDVYYHPNSLFSARFLGEANLMQGKPVRKAGGVVVETDTLSLRVSMAPPPGAENIWVCLRPEVIDIAPARDSGQPGPNEVFARVEEMIFQGAFKRYTVSAGGQRLTVQQPTISGHGAFSEGDRVLLSWSETAPILIADDTR